MTTAIQMTPRSTESLQPAAGYFTEAQEQMILKTFLGGATKEEAVVLLETVRRRRLDPFSRQVYFVKRWDSAKREEVWAIQTSIDGLRSIADRTGHYEGQTKPEWCGADGVWHDVWLAKTPPAAARVGAYKTGFREPAYGVARYDAYVQTKRDGSPTSFWIKMPDLMLAKCAEALAIRKAFPEDTGGLYVAEEMGQDAGEKDVTPPPPQPARKPEAPALPPPEKAPEHVAPNANKNRIAAMWKRAVTEFGELAADSWEAATIQSLGENILSKHWTPEQAAQVEAELFREARP